jgi:DNA-directed RNA polymerase specialized sigma subunit
MVKATFKDIENMYRKYEDIRYKLSMLQPKNVQVFSHSPIYHDGESKVEALAVERVELENQLKLIQYCLNAMTKDERLFIHYRYFMEKDMEIVPALINWSRCEVFRLRKSVLAKTKWLLSIDTKNGQKTS